MPEAHAGRLLDHVHLRVSDLEASKRFYAGALAALGRGLTGEGEGWFSADELFFSDDGRRRRASTSPSRRRTARPSTGSTGQRWRPVDATTGVQGSARITRATTPPTRSTRTGRTSRPSSTARCSGRLRRSWSPGTSVSEQREGFDSRSSASSCSRGTARRSRPSSTRSTSPASRPGDVGELAAHADARRSVRVTCRASRAVAALETLARHGLQRLSRGRPRRARSGTSSAGTSARRALLRRLVPAPDGDGETSTGLREMKTESPSPDRAELRRTR